MNFPKLIVGAFINTKEGVTLNDSKTVRTFTDKNGVVRCSILLTETRDGVNAAGFDQSSKRTCTWTLSPEAAAALNPQLGEDLAMKIAARYKAPHCINVVESSQPQYDGHEPKINPTTGEQVLVNNAPVYRESNLAPMVFDKEGMNLTTFMPTGAWAYAEDTLVAAGVASQAPVVIDERDLSQVD